MNIVMFANTYLPQVGGISISVDRFARAYRRRGHRTLIVAPDYKEAPEAETDILRVPAITNWHHSANSLALPFSQGVRHALKEVRLDLCHSHHPFLVGDMGLRIAARHNVPIAFTWHTAYEHYAPYEAVGAEWLRDYILPLATEYANLCDGVFAPSNEVAETLRSRGVTSPIRVIPTGVDVEFFQRGDGAAARQRYTIPDEATVVGYVGRLSNEKNLPFLADSLVEVLRRLPESHALIVGYGPIGEEVEATFHEAGLADRAHFTGKLEARALVDAYHAVDVFTIASQTETQGMVVTEAMAAGCPVVGLDAPGVRETVRDGVNGRLVKAEEPAAFADAVVETATLRGAERARLVEGARATAGRLSSARCAGEALDFYEELIGAHRTPPEVESSGWASVLRSLESDWDLWRARFRALMVAVGAMDKNHNGANGADE